ncbi:hypothetical protein [Saccharicrinis aurantiacus]|uniref:hypothetical protein n=1 Tax=Saccharicrinis aurantiacus TaxID=1849719 RepID=UPI00249214E9|nr:hypothetical protein [Saccharicrinis aurantiacus]
METTLIVQKEILSNLFITNNDSNERMDIYKFLCNDYRGYKLICDIKLSDYKKHMEDNPMWDILIDNMNTFCYEENISSYILEDAFYDDLGEYNIFLINESNNVCNDLTSKYGFVYLNDRNIESNWKVFNEIRKGVPLKVTKSTLIPEEQRVDAWSKLDFISTPLTSIIVFDNYILKDSDLQRLRDNLYPLLEILLAKSRSYQVVTVTIITMPSKKCIKQIRGQILAHIRSKGYFNAEINIVKHHKRYYPDGFEGLHSRYILTNYLRIKTEDSFNYFQPSGKINNESDIRVDLCLESKNKPLFMKELEDLNIYFSKIDNNPDNPVEDCQVMFHPHKTNDLLN